ncbi:SusC/RagA family TonB-linked outer membrane protein [Sphingobacterium tabacisoli]|nr:SusC/RagA family TonB-linked outer membrane protein [Sphingobacterium tabacisoli]
MKLVMFFLTAAILQVSANGFAQKITLNKTNEPLERVIDDIREQSGYDFFYNKKLIKNAKPISIRVKDEALTKTLDACLDGQNLSYQIKNRAIIITAGSERETLDRAITGVVSNKSDGKALVGVTVQVKGTKTMAQTDDKGRFSLAVPDGGTILVIRYMGYKTQEIAIAEFRHFVISLVADDTELDQVVVTGIFKRPEGNFTGAATSMKGEELKRINSHNLFAAVSALDPSFRIMPNNIAGGNINTLPEVQLRGANSMPNLSGELSANPNAPLFILDGFEVDIQRVVDLDMNLIASITLLKDASATSIYGSRGANGVMVISTIAPAAGRVQVTVNNDFRLLTPDLSVYKLLNAAEKLDFEKRAGVYNRPSTSVANQYFYDKMYNDRLEAVLSGVNTDWLAQPVQTGASNRTSVYLQGGDDYVRYGVQVAGDLQAGVMKGQTRKNYSGQFDLSYKVKNIRFQNSLRVFQNVANESPYGSFKNYVLMNPYWTPFDAQGNVKRELEKVETEPGRFDTYGNPIYDATLHSIHRNKYFGLTNNFQVRYDVQPGLFIEANLSLNKQKGDNDEFLPAQHSSFIKQEDITRRGSYKVRNDDDFGYESRLTANYNKSFGKHLVFSTLGFDIASSRQSFYAIATEGFAFDKLDNLLFATQYEQNGRPTGDEGKVNRIGALVNGSYSYDNRYLADVSIRRDGSSQFGSDKRFGTFWSTGAGWNIHNESFFTTSEIVNRLKLRASYGSSGSINVPAYQAQTRYDYTTGNIYNGQVGASIKGLGNPNLSWQDVRTANFGADIVLFNESLDLRLDHYRALTKNSITQITLASSTGFSSYAENLGEIENNGYEINARYKVINRLAEGFVWSVNGSAARNKNVLKKLSNQLKSLNDKLNKEALKDSPNVPNILLTEGAAINTIYVVPSLGVDPTTGNEVFLTRNGERSFSWNAADKVAYGVTDPKWNGVFGTQVDYKGFNVSLQFDYRFGGQYYNQTLVDRVESVDPKYNVDRRAYDLGWSGPGSHSPYTRIEINKAKTRATSRFVQDENTLNFNSASFSYNFYRHAFVKRWGLNSLQLTAITNDLFRASSIQAERGIDNPFARTYSLSLRVGL